MILILIICLSLTVIAPTQSFGQTSDDVRKATKINWDEFMHYTLIGQWDLALGFGQTLVALDPDPIQVLNLAQSPRYANSYKTLNTLKAKDEMAVVANDILALIEKGRFIERTDIDRIQDEVDRLSTTTRGRMLAIDRLKDSGEWAIPVMIETLRSQQEDGSNDVISNIRWALPKIGKPAVNPLLIVVRHCTELNIQLIAMEALGKIGYRSAEPTIQEIIENQETNPVLRNAGMKALEQIYEFQEVPMVSAAFLHGILAEDYFNGKSSLDLPENENLGTIWFWNDEEGLKYERVPRGAYDELMTMRYCEYAVKLNPNMGDIVSLWLSAFFRLEAQGFSQPDYFIDNHANAETYALTAGPEHLHRVLARALDVSDVNDKYKRDVALAAIKVLQRNSGQQSLLYVLGAYQPLIEALRYPDREVRYSAAIALARSLPKKNFEHSELVMPLLAETLTQNGKRNVIIVDSNSQSRNDLIAKLSDTGSYGEIVSADTFSIANQKSRNLTRVDLILYKENPKRPDLIGTDVDIIKDDYRLAFCPLILVAEPGRLSELNKIVSNNPFAYIGVPGMSAQKISAVETEILAKNNAVLFDQSMADSYAELAIDSIQLLALSGNRVLSPSQIEPSVLVSAYDSRKKIQDHTIQILSRLDSLDSQRMLAKLSLDTDLDLLTRIDALKSLATSAKAHGNLLLSEQINSLIVIVTSQDQDVSLRNHAAEAYGALNLPSVEISHLINAQTIDEL